MELRLGSSELVNVAGCLVARPLTRREEGKEYTSLHAMREGEPTDQCSQSVSQCGSQSGALRVRLVNLVVDRI